MVFGKKEQFKKGEERDSELEKRLKEQKEKVKAHFRQEESKKDLDIIAETVKDLSDEEWEELAKKRIKHQESKPH